VNEFLWKSTDGAPGPDGKSSDWIELYNPGDEAVEMGGWSILDADMLGNNYPGFTFAEGTQLAPHSFMVLMADDTPSDHLVPDSLGLTHVPFKLGKEDGVFLRDANGSSVDWIVYSAETAAGVPTSLRTCGECSTALSTNIPFSNTVNVVWGRLPDGSDTWRRIGSDSVGTPGAPNSGPVGPYVPPARPYHQANQTPGTVGSGDDAPPSDGGRRGTSKEDSDEDYFEWQGLKVFRILRILGAVVGGLLLLATVLILSSPVVYYGVRRHLCGDDPRPPDDEHDPAEIFHDAPAVGELYHSESETEDEQAHLMDGRRAGGGDRSNMLTGSHERHRTAGGIELGRFSGSPSSKV